HWRGNSEWLVNCKAATPCSLKTPNGCSQSAVSGQSGKPTWRRSRGAPGKRDRRTGQKIAVDLPFEFRVYGQNKSVQEWHGRTLNMGSHGLLIAPDQPISLGQPIEISIQ